MVQYISFSPQDYEITVLINELLYGQKSDHILKSLERDNLATSVDIENMYICITGLRQSLFRGLFGADAPTYSELYKGARAKVMEFLDQHEISCEGVINLYSKSKKFVYLMSAKNGGDIDIKMVATAINEIHDEQYKKTFGVSKMSKNYTAFSKKITDAKDIPSEFAKIRKFAKYRFFLSEECVIDEKLHDELYIPQDINTLHPILSILLESVNKNDAEQIAAITETLFLKRLKYNFEFNLVSDILAIIKGRIYGLMRENDLVMSGNLEDILSIEQYHDLEDMREGICSMLTELALNMSKAHLKYSPHVAKAVKYIKNNYRDDISLSSLAKHVNVTQEHLSRTWSREVGSSIPSYIRHLKISYAKELLHDTERKIITIAKELGFTTSHRFGQVFKLETGMTPSEYRSKSNALGDVALK